MEEFRKDSPDSYPSTTEIPDGCPSQVTEQLPDDCQDFSPVLITDPFRERRVRQVCTRSMVRRPEDDFLRLQRRNNITRLTIIILPSPQPRLRTETSTLSILPLMHLESSQVSPGIRLSRPSNPTSFPSRVTRVRTDTLKQSLTTRRSQRCLDQ